MEILKAPPNIEVAPLPRIVVVAEPPTTNGSEARDETLRVVILDVEALSVVALRVVRVISVEVVTNPGSPITNGTVEDVRRPRIKAFCIMVEVGAPKAIWAIKIPKTMIPAKRYILMKFFIYAWIYSTNNV